MSDSEDLRTFLREAKANNKDYKWAKIANAFFEYEGQIRNNKPDGFGRIFWKQSGASYHGMFRNHALHGKGVYFHENGDRFHGNFSENKPCGEGVSITEGKRLIAIYDGHKTFDEGAQPKLLGDAPHEEIATEISFTISAMSKGLDSNNGKIQDFSHCKPLCARLALAVPLRANKPLRNEDEIEGKVAIVMRGGCNFAAKVHHCQRAGAVGVIMLGTDDEDKYRHCFEVAEDDPDLATLPGAPSRIEVAVPVVYALGCHEDRLRPGALVRLAFCRDDPNIPKHLLLGGVVTRPQAILPDLTPAHARLLLEDFLAARRGERRQEARLRYGDAAPLATASAPLEIDGDGSGGEGGAAAGGRWDGVAGCVEGGAAAAGGEDEAVAAALAREMGGSRAVGRRVAAVLRDLRKGPASPRDAAALRAAAALLLRRADEIAAREEAGQPDGPASARGRGEQGEEVASEGARGGAGLEELVTGQLGCMTFGAGPSFARLVTSAPPPPGPPPPPPPPPRRLCAASAPPGMLDHSGGSGAGRRGDGGSEAGEADGSPLAPLLRWLAPGGAGGGPGEKDREGRRRGAGSGSVEKRGRWDEGGERHAFEVDLGSALAAALAKLLR